MNENYLVISNVFKEEEVVFINNVVENYNWKLIGRSNEQSNNIFWYKELLSSPLKNFFEEKISNSLNKKIRVNEIYQNGQAFGQCGMWHKDNIVNPLNEITFVYFSKKWLPEYGGHFLIQLEDKVSSVLPEYNMGILFSSSLSHMALSPSRHCPDQRESIAVKFKLL